MTEKSGRLGLQKRITDKADRKEGQTRVTDKGGRRELHTWMTDSLTGMTENLTDEGDRPE